jgi:hypothetical protein
LDMPLGSCRAWGAEARQTEPPSAPTCARATDLPA